jgi:hypothetical protein
MKKMALTKCFCFWIVTHHLTIKNTSLHNWFEAVMDVAGEVTVPNITSICTRVIITTGKKNFTF